MTKELNEIAEAVETLLKDSNTIGQWPDEASITKAALIKAKEIMLRDEFIRDAIGNDGGLVGCVKSDIEELFNKLLGGE